MSYSKRAQHDLSMISREFHHMDQITWRKFVELLAARADEAARQMVNADPAVVQIEQGRAREIRDLVNILSEGPQVAEQIIQKGQPNGRGNRNPALSL
jgi:hypothetical protein